MPAVLDHLWQSTLFGCAVALLIQGFRHSSASLRFWLWLTASIKFLVPFAVLSAIGRWLVQSIGRGPQLHIVGQAARPFSELAAGGPVVKPEDLSPVFDPAPWFAAVWAAGVIVISAIWLLRWRQLRPILRSSRPLPWAGPISVRTSSSMFEPGLVGFIKPVLLMPESLPRSLSSEEIEAILAHEAIHLERRDNLWGAIHMLVEALFWFHPMVWWVGRRLVVERERACDDAVIQSGHSREVYARAVLESCRLYLRLPFACASGVSSANLADRIEAIMTASAPGQVSTRQKSVLIAAGLLAVAVPLWVGFATAPDLGEARSRMPLASWLFNSGPTTEQIAHDLADEKRPRRQVPYDPARFERFVGDYKFGSYGTMTVSRWRDRFFTQLTGQEVLELYPESDFEFFYKSVPGQISFITDATGRPTALIMHRGGVNQRLPKLGRAGAAELHAALARRIAENQPSPGTEAYVRSFLSSVAADRPDYSGMAPHLAQTAREEWPAQRSALRALGQLKAVRFLRVSPQGADLFEADFEKGRMFLRIAPLERGKAAQIFMRPMS